MIDSCQSNIINTNTHPFKHKLHPPTSRLKVPVHPPDGPTYLSSALSLLDDVSGPAVSIQTELAVEQLKEKHQQELQQLHIQLETQVTP